ncbi:unnamed protein product [Ambrosiozyma monospora]|uniref:Unnamed protein product n=1 Tax=Ambrosiozyma monospora TaxID=43982 RepID=A0A9W6WKA8_AMBMO|nr:unnamed protein product [Ambrosiozyma monospora]
MATIRLVGDLVLLHRDALIRQSSYIKLRPVYFGPFKLVKQLGPSGNAFEVDLPSHEKKHRTINVKFFKHFEERVGTTYTKVPPVGAGELRARLGEIVSIAGMDKSEAKRS